MHHGVAVRAKWHQIGCTRNGATTDCLRKRGQVMKVHETCAARTVSHRKVDITPLATQLPFIARTVIFFTFAPGNWIPLANIPRHLPLRALETRRKCFERIWRLRDICGTLVISEDLKSEAAQGIPRLVSIEIGSPLARCPAPSGFCGQYATGSRVTNKPYLWFAESVRNSILFYRGHCGQDISLANRRFADRFGMQDVELWRIPRWVLPRGRYRSFFANPSHVCRKIN